MAQRPIKLDPTGRDIHGEFSEILRRGPVTRIELPGGVLAWSIAGYQEVKQALSDRRFSKDPRTHWPRYIDGEIGADFPLIGWVEMDNLTTAYGAHHSRLRRLTATAFNPRRVEAMRPAIQKLVAELLNDMGGVRPGESVNLKERFAHPLAARVICDLFGVPEESRADILRGGEVNVDTTISPQEAAANLERWHQQIYDFVDSKRVRPGDDLTTDLIAAQEDDGSRLTRSELAGTLHLMLAAGTEPPTNLICKAVVALLSDPDQRALLDAGTVSWQDVIEETLRAEAPVAHLPFRFAVEDIDIGGVTIARGEPVLIGFAGAGRDPAVHGETAGEFDARRVDKTHVSFGHGIYRCIGAPLAMLEAELALPALFERFPEMSLGVPRRELRPEVTFIMNGFESVPVRLTAGQ